MSTVTRDMTTVAVLANRVDTIVREMENTVFRSGRSAVLNMGRDFSCGLVTGDGRLLAWAEGLPIHVGGMDFLAQSMIELHPDLAPGDAFLHNDPYLGNSHSADHAILVPIFVDGEHVFTAVVKAHQADCGNALPTTYSVTARDIYEEGALNFPCVRVQRDYVENADIVRMCRRRIRVPDQWYGDFLAILGAARIGERRVQELLATYGVDTVRWFIDEWFAYSERRVVTAISELPNRRIVGKGTHDPIDAVPEGIPLQAVIDIDPDEGFIDVDVTGNPDCVPAGLNLSRATAVASVMLGIFNCLDPSLPHNDGSFRRIRVKLRENCIVGGPRFPASCSVATTNVAERMVNLIQAAFAELGDGYGLAEGNVGSAPGYAVISGTDPRRGGAPFINQLVGGGGGGPAGADSDGWLTYVQSVAAGLVYRESIEVLEEKYPIRFDDVRVWTDSEGAGRHRGASGLRLAYRPVDTEMTAIYQGDGHFNPPAGVLGGGPAAPAGAIRVREDGSEEDLPSEGAPVIAAGEGIVGLQSGGGGYGDALDRDPELVRRDVLRRWISTARAGEVYGVVFTGDSLSDGLAVDGDATHERRERLRAHRHEEGART